MFSVFLLSSCTKDSEKNSFPIDNSTTVELRTSCDPNPIVNQPCKEKILTLSFTFDGCIIPYTVRTLSCPNGLRIDPPVYNQATLCPSLKAKLLELYITLGSGAAADLYNQLESAMSKNAELQALISGNVERWSFWQCDSDNNCPNSTMRTPVNMESLSFTCSSICTSFDFEGNGNIYYIKCGEACCKRTTRFCIKYDNTPCYGAPVITSGGTCTPTTWPLTCTNVPTCNSACDKL